jgi:ABC-type sugar transport system ATPase subunit
VSDINKTIQFEKIGKSYQNVNVITSLDLEIRGGERLVLLGPSGCGKSTLMRLIAGLEQPTTGTIKMGGKVVNDIDAADRNIAMVFQNYALYPHMTVFDNIAFSLKLRKGKKEEIKRRVKEAAKMVDIQEYLDRKPAELSGGQRQRVALARAAVRNAPFFLLDEPLSNLDAILRVNARNDLVEMHEKLKNTMVYVTHDQLEAMTIGNRIAIINGGALQQIGTPEEIYHHPANRFVASFIGTPPMNLLPFELANGQFTLGEEIVNLSDTQKNILPFIELLANKKLILGIRPENVKVTAGSKAFAGENDLSLQGVFVRRENAGAHFIYHFTIGTSRVQVVTAEKVDLVKNENMMLIFSLQHLHFFYNDEVGARLSWRSDRLAQESKSLQSI